MTPFHQLHQSGLLVLPNAWDAGSAAIARAVGARAIATTSAGCAWSLGWPDGDALPPERALAMCADVVRAAAGLPVSVDFEGGYSDDTAEVARLAGRLVEAGAAGINIEDGTGDPQLLAGKIAAIRAAVGPDLFINARCDVWLAGVGAPDVRLDEAVRRARLYAEAGSDGFFAPGLSDAEQIRQLVSEVDQPINLLAVPGLAGADVLEMLGVRRLSAGSSLASAAYGGFQALARDFIKGGRVNVAPEATLGWGEMNALMTP